MYLPSTDTATTTAWGRGLPLDKALTRVYNNTETAVVELAIGARPVQDPETTLGAFAHHFTYIAHHAAPVLTGAILRPETHSPKEAAAALSRLDIQRYTIHPPTRKALGTSEFLDWAFSWHDTLKDAGIETRLETMYQPRDRHEQARFGSYFLDTATEVLKFCHAAQQHGWETPLLIDLSHLYIGLCGGSWTGSDVEELFAAGVSDHIHISANDGRRDLHVPLPTNHPITLLKERLVLPTQPLFVVDEGRRDVSPAAL